MALSQSPASAALPVLLSLDEARATDAARCGNKAATLAHLRQRGFPVPPGVVLPVGATLDRAELQAALDRLGGAVAVRSSGLAEDGAHATWAGQFATTLQVQGIDDVLEAIAACLDSAAALSARVYAAEHGGSAPLAVLIQAMVPADAAGVAFTADPLTGATDTMRISATRGLGEDLVSGRVVADEWLLRDGQPQALSTPQQAVDAATVQRLGQLAERVAQTRGGPQDIEWALAGDQLHLLQARPIVDLPLQPEIDVPDGAWSRDLSHFPAPISPLGASTYMPIVSAAMAQAFPRWGLMPDGVEYACIGHEAYSRMLPDSGKPPPWFVLALVARLAPPLRRKLTAAAQAIASGRLESVPARWEEGLRTELLQRIELLASVPLDALEQGALLDHLDQVMALAHDGQVEHFHLFIPYVVRVHELVEVCQELLDWDVGRSLELLQGLSTASSQPTRELQALAARVAEQSAAREIVEQASPDVVEQLSRVAPQLAADLRAHLEHWGLRCLGYDPGQPALIEQPHRVAELLRDLLEAPPAADLEAARLVRIADARAQLEGETLDRFDRALAAAERVYPQREDNILITDNLPGGLIRRAALELGRRLVARGRLQDPLDACFASIDELRQPPEDLAQRVDRRRREIAWVRAHPGPMTHGPVHGQLPDVRGLPQPARRINGALLWMAAVELAPPPEPTGDGLAGIAASGGRYTGVVRVVRDQSQLHRLQRGEVLVCPITTPAWAVYFSRAGALVTDGGSVLSHAAIIAREHGVPAVVATSDATQQLRDGMQVTVDGSTGAVVVHQG